MKHLDLNNPENKKSIQEILRTGAQSDFWHIICQRLGSSIEAISSQLDSDEGTNLIAEEYKIRHEVLRKQKIDHKYILKMPEELMKELDNPEFFERKRDEDVYLEKEDFEK